MNIKILSFSSEIIELRNNQIFSLEIAEKYAGALWVSYLKNRCPFDFEFQTVDKTLELVRVKKVDPSSVLVFQHNLDKEAALLIRLGAFPFLLSMYESPLYCGKFYETINENLTKFHHVKIFGANLFKSGNLSQAYFPCFSRDKCRSYQQKEWMALRFASMVIGNKYVLTRPLYSFNNLEDWTWWFAKFIRQYFMGPKIPKKIDIRKTQLQDMRYELIGEMLRRDLLDLYGRGWDRLFRIPPSTAKKISPFVKKGGVPIVENKGEIISAYRFNICFENLSYPGYITEKIFDALLSKTIPVYCGAPDISDFIPENIYIDASKFKKISNLIDYLANINVTEANEIIENGQKFLRSSKGEKFSYEVIADEIIELLGQFLRINSPDLFTFKLISKI